MTSSFSFSPLSFPQSDSHSPLHPQLLLNFSLHITKEWDLLPTIPFYPFHMKIENPNQSPINDFIPFSALPPSVLDLIKNQWNKDSDSKSSQMSFFRGLSSYFPTSPTAIVPMSSSYPSSSDVFIPSDSTFALCDDAYSFIAWDEYVREIQLLPKRKLKNNPMDAKIYQNENRDKDIDNHNEISLFDRNFTEDFFIFRRNIYGSIDRIYPRILPNDHSPWVNVYVKVEERQGENNNNNSNISLWDIVMHSQLRSKESMFITFPFEFFVSLAKTYGDEKLNNQLQFIYQYQSMRTRTVPSSPFNFHWKSIHSNLSQSECHDIVTQLFLSPFLPPPSADLFYALEIESIRLKCQLQQYKGGVLARDDDSHIDNKVHDEEDHSFPPILFDFTISEMYLQQLIAWPSLSSISFSNVTNSFPNNFVADLIHIILSYCNPSDSAHLHIFPTNSSIIKDFSAFSRDTMVQNAWKTAIDSHQNLQIFDPNVNLVQRAHTFGLRYTSYSSPCLFYCIPLVPSIIVHLPSSLCIIQKHQLVFLLPVDFPHTTGDDGGNADRTWRFCSQPLPLSEDRASVLFDTLGLCEDHKGDVDLRAMDIDKGNSCGVNSALASGKCFLFISADFSNEFHMNVNYTIQPLMTIRDIAYPITNHISQSYGEECCHFHMFYSKIFLQKSLANWNKYLLSGPGKWVSPLSNIEYTFKLSHGFGPSWYLSDDHLRRNLHEWPSILVDQKEQYDEKWMDANCKKKLVSAAVYANVGQLFPLRHHDEMKSNQSDKPTRLSSKQKDMLSKIPWALLPNTLRKLRADEYIDDGTKILVAVYSFSHDVDFRFLSFPTSFHSTCRKDFHQFHKDIQKQNGVTEWMKTQFETKTFSHGIDGNSESLPMAWMEKELKRFVAADFEERITFFCPALEETETMTIESRNACS